MTPANLTTSILSPEETLGKRWIAVIEEWHVVAESREHAERLIEVGEMCFAKGVKTQRETTLNALGLSTWGGSVRADG